MKPILIPDFLALVGDTADGFPGIPGIGKVSAARMLNQYGPIENFPPAVLGEQRELALLFKSLATLVTDRALFKDVKELQWKGPTPAFARWATKNNELSLLKRANAVAEKLV